MDKNIPAEEELKPLLNGRLNQLRSSAVEILNNMGCASSLLRHTQAAAYLCVSLTRNSQAW